MAQATQTSLFIVDDVPINLVVIYRQLKTVAGDQQIYCELFAPKLSLNCGDVSILGRDGTIDNDSQQQSWYS